MSRCGDGYLQKTIEAAIKDCTEVYTGTVKNRTGGGGRDATFVELDGRVMAHTELSTNRRLAFRAIIQEYQENLHLMDKQGYVPVCYRLMAMKYHLSEQALSDAGVDAKKYGLLEKRTKQGKDFKTELRIKPTPGFAIGDFPKLEKTKRPGGKRYACPSCSLEEATIKKKTSIVFICRNPDCERCDIEQEMYSEEKQRRQKRSKQAQKQEAKHAYSCTLSPEEEEKSSASQVDVSEHEEVCRGEYEDTQASQVDVVGSNELMQMECEEQQEELEILPFLYTDSQVDKPMDDEFPFQEEDHAQDAPIVEINTTHPPPFHG